jgi:hypothetical protein
MVVLPMLLSLCLIDSIRPMERIRGNPRVCFRRYRSISRRREQGTFYGFYAENAAVGARKVTDIT